MKPRWPHLDKYRVQREPYCSPLGATFGAFEIPFNGKLLRVIASDGRLDSGGKLPDTEWEHVSVHAWDAAFRKAQTPTWDQMCFVKDLFWSEDELVLQFHPAKSDYINVHPHVLHLWRPKVAVIPMPPKICV
jgi:hypothetical protein